jgi:hypothetical protein
MRAAQQTFEGEALLLTAGERGQLAAAKLAHVLIHHALGRGIPIDLGVVTAGLAPLAQRFGIGHWVVVHVHLGLGQEPGGVDDTGRGQTDEEVPHGCLVPDRSDQLAHDAESAIYGDRAFIAVGVAADEPHERCLASAIGADERGVVPVVDLKTDIVE